jgi:hypothetical protein
MVEKLGMDRSMSYQAGSMEDGTSEGSRAWKCKTSSARRAMC